MIAGFASLGLPGLSGFVAGDDDFRRLVRAYGYVPSQLCDSRYMFHRDHCSLYSLRVVGKLLLGLLQDEHHLQLTDATWFERFSTVTLIVAIAGIGCFQLDQRDHTA